MERYPVSLHIQSKCGKVRSRQTPNTIQTNPKYGYFSRSRLLKAVFEIHEKRIRKVWCLNTKLTALGSLLMAETVIRTCFIQNCPEKFRKIHTKIGTQPGSFQSRGGFLEYWKHWNKGPVRENLGCSLLNTFKTA